MAFFNKNTGPTGKKAIPQLNWTLVNGQWVYPEDNADEYIMQGYKALPNVYAIISLIISKSSIVPFEVFRIKNRAKHAKYKAAMQNITSTKDVARTIKLKNEALEKVEGTELERLLLKPNNYQGMEQLNEQIDGYKLLTGNSFVWAPSPMAGRNTGKPVQLHTLPSPMVAVVAGTFLEPVRGYRFNLYEEELPKEQIMHFKTFNPLDSHATMESMVYGMSPLKSCRRLLGKYRDADIAQGSMFKNMGPSGILSNESENASEEQAIAIKDRYKKNYSGPFSSGDIIVTASKFKWEQIGLSPVDLNIIESKEEILNEICNVYHVPIGMFTKANSTENNMVESRKMFITDAVMPLVEHRKSVFNRELAPRFGEDLVIEYDYTVFGEIQEDLEKLVKSAKDMYWITPQEKRAMTGYDNSDNPEMEKFYFPSGVQPLDKMNAEEEVVDERMLDPNFQSQLEPNDDE